jgi:hypothetical protein
MKWYSAVALYSEYYLKPAAVVNEPFAVLPAAVYRESEVSLIPEDHKWRPMRVADRKTYTEEVKTGIPLGGENYLRRFPVWFDYRGNNSIVLAEAKGLAAAGRLRGDLEAVDLAQKQAQWIVGRNPFASSVMYGEGYDWHPLYSVRSGPMVGALSVGIETKGFADAPYWPHQNCWTYKEVWVQPVGQWIWLMDDISVSASVTGLVDVQNRKPIQFREQRTGHVTTAVSNPNNGGFSVHLPEGRYDVKQGAAHTSLTVLPGGTYGVDLRSDRVLDFKVISDDSGKQEVVVRVKAEGAGKHAFDLRSDNLKVEGASKQELDLQSGGTEMIVWHAHVVDAKTPWVAVVVPDGKLGERQEATSSVSSK